MYSDDSDYYYEYDYYKESYMDILEFCIIPTLYQASQFMIETFSFSLLFLITNRLVVKSTLKRHHCISFAIGFIYMIYFAFRNGFEIFIIIPLNILSYAILITHYKSKNKSVHIGIALLVILIAILVIFEFYYEHEAWLKVRSVMMIAMMKILSIAFDLSRKGNLIDVLGFMGYLWCPANLILGPWHSYNEYAAIFYTSKRINYYWVLSAFKYIIGALAFVTFSNCINAYLIDDSFDNFSVSYREASTFRLSHYFVSYLGSAGMILAGYSTPEENEGPNSPKWHYTITKPLKIEFPRSLVNVVIYWNIPTHKFLKNYIFKDFLPYGRFFAIFMTYVVSSMLHGLNVEISIVLLSLGLFSYFQFKFQEVFSMKLSVCAQVRECHKCTHKSRSNSSTAQFFVAIFSFITIIYLAYIGCLMESVDTENSSINIIYACFKKWSSLLFIGHLLILISYIFMKCFSRL